MQNDLLIEKCKKEREKQSEEHEDFKSLAYGLFHLNYDVCN